MKVIKKLSRYNRKFVQHFGSSWDRICSNQKNKIWNFSIKQIKSCLKTFRVSFYICSNSESRYMKNMKIISSQISKINKDAKIL